MSVSDPRVWVAQAPEAALDFLIAGSIGERHVLGHALPKGFEGDVNRFKIGCGVGAFEEDAARLWLAPAIRRVDAVWPVLEPQIRLLTEEILERVSVASGRAVVITRAELANFVSL